METNNVLWKNRLSVKIPMVMAVVILIVIVVMCSVLSLVTSSVVNKMVNKEISYIADKNSKLVESYLDSMRIFSQAQALNVAQIAELEPEVAKKMMIDALKGVLSEEKIFSAYFAFEPNKFFPDTPNGVSYYAFRNGSDIGMDILNDYDSYGTADYYATTKELMKTHVTEPYEWELSTGEKIWLITLSTPVLNKEGEFVGVANCDIDCTNLENIAYETGGYDSSYSYIVSKAEICLAHTADVGVVGSVPTTVSDNAAIDEAVKGGTAINDVIANPFSGNDSAYILHSPLTLAGTDVNWSSAFVVNKSEANRAVTTLTLLLLGIGAIGLLLLILISSLAVKKALAPVETVMGLADKLGRCDMSPSEGNLVHSQDELGVLSKSFEDMSATISGYMNDISAVLDNVSKGNLDLTVDKEFIGDFVVIKDDLNKILDALNTTFIEMKTAADQVASGAEQFSDGAQALSQGAIEQASSIEQLSARVVEITKQVRESAMYANDANNKAESVGTELENSNEQMKQLLGAMKDITDTSAQIGNIIKTIEDIAFQTNILALNAAVEAARAGAAGKGFAVVADEVRNLASKSAEAAANTTALIESSLKSVQEGSKYAEITAESLDNVVRGTKDIIDAIGEISSKTELQSQSLEAVNSGIEQISSVVQTNAATAEESAATSEELSAQANLLKEQIATFRIRE